MSNFKKGLKLLESKCGNNRDNVISLATVSTNLNDDGHPIPSVRNVNAYYENGVFYIVTYGKSNKMIEISKNSEVAFLIDRRNITGNGVAENLGWVLDPKNFEIRRKLRSVFAKWYDEANNEEDENFCYAAIHIKNATVVTGHGPTTKKYFLDFVNQKEIDEVKEMKEREAYYFTFKGSTATEKGRDYIFEWLAKNDINLELQTSPIYIFGSYDLSKTVDIDFEYTLYIILPKAVKLKEKPLNKKVFGGLYARRFTTFDKHQTSALDLYQTFAMNQTYQPTSAVIIEQYLLDKHKFTKSTQVLQVLSVELK